MVNDALSGDRHYSGTFDVIISSQHHSFPARTLQHNNTTRSVPPDVGAVERTWLPSVLRSTVARQFVPTRLRSSWSSIRLNLHTDTPTISIHHPSTCINHQHASTISMHQPSACMHASTMSIHQPSAYTNHGVGVVLIHLAN